MPQKKKILYLITKGNFGGAQRYVYDLASSLPQDRFEPVVACGQGGLLIERLRDSNIKTIEIEELGREIESRKDFKVLKRLIRIIKEERPDVIHLNSSKIGFLGSLAILYLRIFQSSNLPIPKSIFTAHGWAFSEKKRSSFARFIFLLAHYLTLLTCAKTIAVSERAKRDVSSLPFVNNKIRVIHNGIDDFKLLKKEEARIELAGGETDRTVIFSISELNHNKGIDVALRGLSMLPKEAKKRIMYCIAGTGEERENLEKLASNYNSEEKIRFLGFVPNAKELLSGSDIFLMPSRTEAFPYALLEAGMAGMPIVAACVGGIPEVIKDMQNGILIHPQNPKEIAEAILYILDHKDKRKEFKSEIKKTIQNFFSLEKMVEETSSLYL